MGSSIIARQFDHAIVARHHAIGGQRKGFERGFSPQTGKDMRCCALFMVTPLGAHVVERRVIRDFHLKHTVKARGDGAVL